MRAGSRPTIWVFEVTLYGLIFLGFLGNTLALQKGAHFRVQLLCQVFPKLKPTLDFFSKFMTLLFSVLIFTSGLYFIWYSVTNSIVSASLLEIPMWIPQLAIPLGGLGLFFETLSQLIQKESTESHEIMSD
jgi:TRAP-type C4-dicarboxylate transport system permease small subunit